MGRSGSGVGARAEGQGSSVGARAEGQGSGRVRFDTLKDFAGFLRHATTLFAPHLTLFLRLFQELAIFSLRDNLGASENILDAQGSGATAPLLEHRAGECGEGSTGEGGAMMRCRTGKVHGT